MHRLTLTSLILAALAAPVAATDAALLMGVDRYQDFRRVTGGTDLMTGITALREAGYAVSSLENGEARDMQRLLSALAGQTGDAERLVVGLSGRFVTDGTRTWLLAADAPADLALFTLERAVSVDSVLAVLAQVPGRAVLMLGADASATDRIDAYLRQGIGAMAIPQGVTVLTAPPNVVDDIIDQGLTAPGGDLIRFARETRAVQLSGYQPRQLVLQAAGPAVPAPVAQADPALGFWQDAQAADTAEAYRVFLLGFPDSPYAAQARARLEAIENDPVLLAEQAETALALSRAARQDIQADLTLLDYDTRGVDGIFGQGTRRAIRNWQQINGFAQTSFLTREQIDRIDAQASRRQAELDVAAEAAATEAARLDRAYWEETGALGTEAGYRAYLSRYPEGEFAAQATAALAALPGDVQAPEVVVPAPASPADDPAALAREQALNINPIMARLIEGRLEQMGFNPGTVDGTLDRQSRNAIRRYQQSSDLDATGYLDQRTLARLLADTLGR